MLSFKNVNHFKNIIIIIYYNRNWLSTNCKQLVWRHSKTMASFESVKMVRPLRVSVEGNIGSGKSTLINYFKQFPFIQAYDEPLDKWRNCQGHNLLGLLYDDLKKWSGTFQSYVQLTRTQLQSSSPNNGVKVQLFERSVQNNRHCFLERAHRSGSLSDPEYAVLCEWYDWIESNIDISLDLIVYLRSTPDVVFERIKARNRSEEKGISRDYLESLHEAHERWLTNPNLVTPVCVLDADLTLNSVTKSYDQILPYLMQTKLPVSQVIKS